MTKQISHYVARFDMPNYTKGERVIINETAEKYPDVFAPVYKEDPVIPPGIVAFKNHRGEIWNFEKAKHIRGDLTYETWVDYNLRPLYGCPPSVIHTISVNGTEWSIDEQTPEGKISAFIWAKFMWLCELDGNVCSRYAVSALKKLSTLICQLPDENGKMTPMYERDTSYWVFLENFKIGKDIIQNTWGTSDAFKHFATLPAAEKYVFDNQPFYPRGLMEPILNPPDNLSYREIMEPLKAFKEKHLKDKV